MLRGFINCKNTEERIDYIVNSKAADWTESEVNAVMDIVGLDGDYSSTPVEDKLNIVVAKLGFSSKAAENDNTIFTRLVETEDREGGLTQEDKDRIATQYANFVSHYYAKSSNSTEYR